MICNMSDVRAEDIKVTVRRQVVCPQCCGTGQRPIYDNEGPKAGGPECYTCGGAKVVDEDVPVSLAEGLALITKAMDVKYTDAASVLLFNKHGNVLCVSRKTDANDFGLPGGKVEPNETPAQGAVRELFEETGYVVAEEDVYLVYSAPPETPSGYTEHVFAVRRYQEGTPSTEAGAVKWLSPIALFESTHTFADYNGKLFTHLYKTDTWPAAAEKI